MNTHLIKYTEANARARHATTWHYARTTRRREGRLWARLDAIREILRTPESDTIVTAPYITWATWM
jgi:hypothetical protein